jgi:hypothetical protein
LLKAKTAKDIAAAKELPDAKTIWNNIMAQRKGQEEVKGSDDHFKTEAKVQCLTTFIRRLTEDGLEKLKDLQRRAIDVEFANSGSRSDFIPHPSRKHGVFCPMVKSFLPQALPPTGFVDTVSTRVGYLGTNWRSDDQGVVYQK